MKFLDNRGINDPVMNLAIEEYALKHLPRDTDYLLFYVNGPSIIIGKNQNTIEEVNKAYVEEHALPVVRRLSGGGAVYHDLGNLNFSFIMNDDGHSFANFEKFTKPVVKALQEIGVEAVLRGRNDLVVGERKISGNAQYAWNGRMFHHGTLMFDLNVENLVQSLNVKQEKIISKGIQSVRSRVANIKEFLAEEHTEMTVEALRMHILSVIFADDEEIPVYQWTDEDWRKIEELAETRYRNWDWNYGKSPKFEIERKSRFTAGQIDVRFSVVSGHIVACKIFGDFFGTKDVRELAQWLIGTRYDRQALKEALSEVDLSAYFGKVSLDEFLGLLC